MKNDPLDCGSDTAETWHLFTDACDHHILLPLARWQPRSWRSELSESCLDDSNNCWWNGGVTIEVFRLFDAAVKYLNSVLL